VTIAAQCAKDAKTTTVTGTISATHGWKDATHTFACPLAQFSAILFLAPLLTAQQTSKQLLLESVAQFAKDAKTQVATGTTPVTHGKLAVMSSHAKPMERSQIPQFLVLLPLVHLSSKMSQLENAVPHAKLASTRPATGITLATLGRLTAQCTHASPTAQ